MPAPLAPSDLALARIWPDQIEVSWTDNASDEDAYIVEYKKATALSWVVWADDLAPDTETTTIDDGLDRGVEYMVRVRATNVDGDSANVQDSIVTNPQSVVEDHFVLMDEVPGVGDDPIIGYECRTPLPSIVNPATNQIITAPAGYTLYPAEEGDAYVEDEVTVTGIPNITEHDIVDIEHTLWHAKRSNVVSRWEVRYTHDSVPVDVSWLRRVDHGNEFNINSRIFENWQQPNEIIHNPTMMGADWDGLTTQDTLEASPTVLHENASGPMGTAYTVGATHPLQFDPSGDREGAHYDHGGSESIQACFWPWVQVEMQDPCAPIGHTFRALVHRVVAWEYCPKGWSPHEFDGNLVCQFGFGPGTIDIFDQAYYRNLATGVTTEIADWDDSGNTETAIWSFTRHHYEAEGDVVIAPTTPSPFPEGYVAAIYRDPATDFTVGFAFKLAPFDFDELYDGNGCTAPNWFLMAQSRFPLTYPRPTDYDDNSGQWFFLFSRGNSRVQGWVGSQIYVYTGPFEHVEEALDDVYEAGLLDAPLPEPPAGATDGTLPVYSVERIGAPMRDGGRRRLRVLTPNKGTTLPTIPPPPPLR